jgi:hypothetical protein
MFILFLAIWIVARHKIYVFLCCFIYRDLAFVMSYELYSLASMQLEDPNKMGE